MQGRGSHRLGKFPGLSAVRPRKLAYAENVSSRLLERHVSHARGLAALPFLSVGVVFSGG